MMSGPCLMRRICLELEEQFRGIVGRYRLLEDSSRQMPISDTLTSELIQSLSNKMPALINYQTVMEDTLEQLREQLKEPLAKKQRTTIRQSQQEEMQQAMQVLQYERQMFHEAIRDAQRQKEEMQSEIEALRAEQKRASEQKQVLKEERKEIERQRDDLVLILRGEHMKSETLDRELMESLIKYQDSQLRVVERDSSLISAIQKCKQTEIELQMEREKLMKIQYESHKEKQRLQAALQQSISIAQAKQELTATSILQEQRSNCEAEVNVLRRQIIERDQKIADLQEQCLQMKERISVNQLDHRRRLSNMKEEHEEKLEEWRVIQGKKMAEVQRMHSEIEKKIQLKTLLLQQALSEMKKKYRKAKQEIDRLYESLEVQVKREMELRIKETQWSESIEKIKDNYGRMELQMDSIQQNSALKDTAIRALEKGQKQQKRKRQDWLLRLNKMAKEVGPLRNAQREIKTAMLEETSWLRDQIDQTLQAIRGYSELVRLQNIHMEDVEKRLLQQKENAEQQWVASQVQLKTCQGQLKKCQDDLSCSQRRICQFGKNMDDRLALEGALHSAKDEIHRLSCLLSSQSKNKSAVIPQARMEHQRARMESLQKEYQSLQRADLLPQ